MLLGAHKEGRHGVGEVNAEDQVHLGQLLHGRRLLHGRSGQAKDCRRGGVLVVSRPSRLRLLRQARRRLAPNTWYSHLSRGSEPRAGPRIFVP